MEPAIETASARQALETLYERESPAVFGYLVVRCGSRSIAEDLTTEVFVEAARRAAEGRVAELSGGWLMTVAKRRLIDHWRRADRERRRLERLQRERSVASPLHEDDGRVLAALDSLPQRQRLALTLRYLDDHSVAEVAELMNVEYRAAESLLARARRSFEHAFGAAP